MCRVIQQHSLSSPNKALIGTGVGRGQVLARKLMKVGIGKGRSVPSSKATRPDECGGHMDASTSANIPLPITMRLDHQGPPVSYSEVASRPLGVRLSPQGPCGCMMCGRRLRLMKKKRQPLRPPWTVLNDKNRMSRSPEERRRSKRPTKLTSMRPSKDW